MAIYTPISLCGQRPKTESLKHPRPPTSGSNVVKPPKEVVVGVCNHLDPLDRNELVKAMLGRGVDYETIQLILNDFDLRVEHLRSVVYVKENQ